MILKLISDLVFLKKKITILIAVLIYCSSIVAQKNMDTQLDGVKRDYFFLSIPFGNSIYYNSPKIQKELKGFLFGTVGYKRYYSKNNAVTFNFGIVNLFPTPIPIAMPNSDSYETAGSHYLTLKNETDFFNDRLCLGYGVALASYEYLQNEYRYDQFNRKEGVDSIYHTISYVEGGGGVSLSAYYNFKEIFGVKNKVNLKLGVNYIPTFNTVDNVHFRYYHTLFIDVRLDLNFLFKRSRANKYIIDI